MTREESIKNLMQIPGVGKSIANDLYQIGILRTDDLKGRDPEELFAVSNAKVGVVQDRCLLYVFRGAVYYAETPKKNQEAEKLKWWNWSDKNLKK
ncbi:helix-hairpin-helix domain-containing protein [Chryseobacterium sp.]|uniref:helix-hairpin-helix domain-containing protein n=1 Tax=Chryseobacterium sp. TaxID=1871047 RepID=UPI0011C99FC2|nr:helix-hairpin-helix domain-containing protein [Chryseobacterium sp.]TXF77589.1 pathogenicity locus [Chryseobacterium sp.]